MFSLGLIKVQTCFYGAVSIVRNDEDLHQKMVSIQKGYPMFTKALFIKRIITSLLLMILTLHKFSAATMFAIVRWAGKEREDFYVNLVRGFRPNENYLLRYRFNPCGALLAFIY
jgi:hypothetical protein